MTDIVERLNENIIADAFERKDIADGALCERLIRERKEAADTIETLRADNARLLGERERQWCRTCGTISNNGECHCTTEGTGTRDAVNYADDMAETCVALTKENALLQGKSGGDDLINALKKEARQDADEIEALRAENARLQKATTPICVGRGVIGHMAKDGIWTSENGASVVAADELFRNDPYEEIARLREALRPFADEAKFLSHDAGDNKFYYGNLKCGDLRAALKAMGESDE